METKRLCIYVCCLRSWFSSLECLVYFDCYQKQNSNHRTSTMKLSDITEHWPAFLFLWGFHQDFASSSRNTLLYLNWWTWLSPRAKYALLQKGGCNEDYSMKTAIRSWEYVRSNKPNRHDCTHHTCFVRAARLGRAGKVLWRGDGSKNACATSRLTQT